MTPNPKFQSAFPSPQVERTAVVSDLPVELKNCLVVAFRNIRVGSCECLLHHSTSTPSPEIKRQIRYDVQQPAPPPVRGFTVLSMKQTDLRDKFKKASKSVSTLPFVVSPEPVSYYIKNLSQYGYCPIIWNI
jgi:hypothetical protein